MRKRVGLTIPVQEEAVGSQNCIKRPRVLLPDKAGQETEVER